MLGNATEDSVSTILGPRWNLQDMGFPGRAWEPESLQNTRAVAA